MKVMQQLLGRVLGEKVGDRSSHNVRRRLKLGVDRVEEIVAVAWIELPGVLAI